MFSSIGWFLADSKLAKISGLRDELDRSGRLQLPSDRVDLDTLTYVGENREEVRECVWHLLRYKNGDLFRKPMSDQATAWFEAQKWFAFGDSGNFLISAPMTQTSSSSLDVFQPAAYATPEEMLTAADTVATHLLAVLERDLESRFMRWRPTCKSHIPPVSKILRADDFHEVWSAVCFHQALAVPFYISMKSDHDQEAHENVETNQPNPGTEENLARLE